MTTKSATDVDQQVGARVRARRMALKISQTALAEAAGITFQQIQKYEKGTNRIGSSRLTQLAKTLDVPVSYFFEGLDGTVEAPDVLADPNVAELLSAFRAIENKDMRRALVGIAQIVSGTAGASEAKRSVAGSSGRKQGRSPKASQSL